MDVKENYLRAIKRNYPDWFPYGEDEATVVVLPAVVERPPIAGKDAFGVEWSFSDDTEGGTYPSENNLVLTDLMKWSEQVIFPNIDSLDWATIENKAATIDRSKYIVGAFSEMGIFERAYLLMGMENALVAYMEEPELMYELCGAIADYKIKLLTRYHEAVKFDICWYGDDWGTQANLFVSPQVWREIIKPHTKRIYNCLHELGALINQHSCGKIESIFADLVEIGADMWNPCQPCNDLKKLKKLYGKKITFCGGVDSQFVLGNPQTTPDDVIEEVKKCIDILGADYGGYIIAPSHSVPYDKNKLDAMKNTARNYGIINK